MAKACTIKAHVRNSNGEIVESRLFNDLLHYTSNNRELAKEYYKVGTSEAFLSKIRDNESFKTDENGEITFQSLRVLSQMDLETDKLVQILNEDIGQGEYSYEEALSKIQNFNNTNSFSDKMLATMVYSGNNKYFVSVVPKTKTVTNSEGKEEKVGNSVNQQKQLHDTVRNEELNRKIKDLLRRYNVSVEFLDEGSTGGRYSTENAVKTQDGLYGLIQLSHNEQTTDVLAEEAGHFAVGALGDNPLVQRLEKLLEKKEAQKEALGEEEYNSANLGNNPAREVAGRLVGKALQKKLSNRGPVRVLADRIANLAKRIFSSISGNEVRWAAAKAEQIANRIAYQFVEGDNKFSVDNAVSIKETMKSSKLTVNQRTYRDVMDELGRMVNRLKAISQDQFTGKIMASQAMAAISGTNQDSGESALQMDANTVSIEANAYAFDGIVQALVQVTDYLGPDKEIDQLLKAVDLNNPADFYANMARNGKYLRQARTFLRSAEIILDTIEHAINPDRIGGALVLANGSTLEDIKYQDEKGNWRSINLKGALTGYKQAIVASKQELTVLEQSYFARFCEDIYGNKYITTTVGKVWSDIWHGQELFGEQPISIENMVLGEGMEDVDVFHRYLGSMANNPDVIGQIIDKLVKTANKTADDQAIQYRNKLRILKARAEKLGLDVRDLVELDEDGLPTGNMIMPPAAPTEHQDSEDDFIYQAYVDELEKAGLDEVPSVNYGAWEKKRDEFKKAAWEKFKEDNPDYQAMSGFIRGYKWDTFLRSDPVFSMKKWNQENSLKVEVRNPDTNEILYVKWVPNLTYATDSWEQLRAKYKPVGDDSLDKWMNDFRKIKEELDSRMPLGSTTSYRLPQFRGTFVNSVRNTMALEEGNLKGARATLKTWGRRVILESFVETSDETDYGDMTTMNSPEEELLGTKLNYEEERAARIPVFGINKLKDMRDLSTDLFHSMLAYASMATSYDCLNNIVDALEVGAEALYNRDLKGDNENKRKRGKKLGSAYRDPSGRYEARFTGSKNRAFGRYLKYLDKQVYGISAAYWGIPIGKGKRILLNKIIKNISSLGGTLFLKGNVLGGTVNTLTGFNNILKEATVGDDFDLKDWTFANNYYFRNCPEMWMQFGNLTKDDKLSLFLMEMNTSGNNREEFRNWETSKSRLNNIYRKLGYLPYSSGDHYMQAMSYLAVAHGTRLFDINGAFESNLWDAYKRIKNTDEFNQYSQGYSLEFAKLCPLNAKDITSDALQEKGIYLKPVTKSGVDFEQWLIWYHPEFKDEAYRSNNKTTYNALKGRYYDLDEKAMMQYKSEVYNTLASILQKVEDYVFGNSPLKGVPTFNTIEQEYLDSRNIGAGDYNSTLQTVRDDIFSIIWTKADESGYMDRCREINNRLHGIYNEQDKTAFHQQWYTNAFLAMKGWALGYLEMMYSNNHYSVALGRNVEGFVSTALKIHADTISGLFGNKNALSFWDMIISMIAPWSQRSVDAMKKAGFSEEQNMNARRMAISAFLMGILYALRLATAPPDKDSKDDDEEDPMTGLIYYMAMRTLLEQEALLYVPEAFIQSGQLMDFLPVGFSALNDLRILAGEGMGAMFAPETDSQYFYQRDSKDVRYLKGDSHFKHHVERLIPYYKSYWAIQHPYEAAKNYNFGRKLRSR